MDFDRLKEGKVNASDMSKNKKSDDLAVSSDYREPFTGTGTDLRGQTNSGLDLRPVPLSAGFMAQTDRSWNFEHVFSPFWRLYFADHQDMYLVAEDGTHAVPAGGFLLVPSEYHFHCRTKGCSRHLWIHFSLQPPFLRTLKAPYALSGTCRENHAAQALAALARDIAQDLHKEQGDASVQAGVQDRFRLTHRIQGLLHLVLAEVPFDRHPRLPIALERGLRTAHEHIHEPVSIAQLARKAGVSPEHMAQLFRQHLQQSPSDYLRTLRIREAARRLAYTDDTIDAIADSVSFANRHHFSRVFKKMMNEAPAAFRTRVRARNLGVQAPPL